MLNQNYPIIDTIQIRSNSLVGYELHCYHGNLSASSRLKISLNIHVQKKKAYSGTLTDGCKKRMSRAIDILCQTVKTVRIYNPVNEKWFNHRLTYLTLTISQDENLTNSEVQKTCFTPFLQWLRRTMKVNTYVWKCEQQERGQIHYHITTTSFIHYQKIRDKWNNLQRAAGYINEFKIKYGHEDPNSTDIHSVRSVKNLANYMIKEFCKAIQNPQTDGKVWDCSFNLKGQKYFSIEETDFVKLMVIDEFDRGRLDIISLDKCWIYKSKGFELLDVLDLKQMKEYKDWIEYIRNLKREKDVFQDDLLIPCYDERIQ